MISWPLKNNNAWPIGLDIGHHSIYMVQLIGSGSGITVQDAQRTIIDPSAAGDPVSRNNFIVSAIKQMLEHGQFTGRKVITSLTNDKVHITSLRLASLDENNLEHDLREEAKDRFGLDGEQDCVQHLNVGQVTQGEEIKNELILFAASDSAIREHISLLESANLEPVGIDLIPCALFRSIARSMRRQEDQDQAMVLIDIGSRYTTVVFGKAGQINFIKEIPVGADAFDQRISDKLGINPQEAEMLRATLRTERHCGQGSKINESENTGTAVGQGIDVATRQTVVDAVSSVAGELAREISLCFRYYTVTFRGKRVERSVFSGGGAYEDILLNLLKRQLTVEPDMAEPFRGFDMSSVKPESGNNTSFCEWSVAAGLALKQIPNLN